MKRLTMILIALFLCTQAFALEVETFNINITVNKPPTIEGLLPEDGFVITEGDTVEISVVATDPNDDMLQYQFLVNGAIKRPWDSEPLFSYTLGSDDIGLNKISVEVTDSLETVQTEEVEIWVFRRSPDTPTG